jgi:acyl transferase domain-containing protein/thioesterase domain-containing protein
MSLTDPDGSIRRLVLGRLREWHGVDPAQVSGDRPLAELGATSRDAVALAAELGELVGVTLPATLLWEAPTLDQLVRRVGDASNAGRANRPARPGGLAGPGRAGGPASASAAVAVEAEAKGEVEAEGEPAWSAVATDLDPGAAIAVIGVGCRLPGAVASPAEFWRLLSDGVDAVATLPEGRWAGFVAPEDPALGEVSRHGGFLDDIAGFDAEFFGITPSEAAAMDPQQRLLLEVTRESLDHAAIPTAALAGTRTGVFIGISGNEYAHLTTAELDRVEAWTPPGAALSIAANRLSYVFDLRGPSLAMDTACSSSLVAVHHAVRSLVGGECDTALAGGVNVLLSPALTLAFQRAGALAPDGRCKTFDASADGMVRAEGCAVVVLRRLADAERAGDRVLAVIRASAVNSDGRSNGLLAPNAEAQRALLAEVYAAPGVVAPIEVDYVEAHGTGTALGDPVEAGALGAVLGRGRNPDQPLLIGSVKTNLGHLEAAAGITGLVKTVLALHHGELPPHLHYTEPSPHIDFDALALRVVTATEPWPRYSGTATAGVSAFGFGGTNAHVVLQEYRPDAAPSQWVVAQATAAIWESAVAEVGGSAGAGASAIGAPAVLVFDASTPGRLREDAADLADWLAAEAGTGADADAGAGAGVGAGVGAVARVRLADVSHTLSGRLGKGRHRAAVVARTAEQAAEALSRLAEGRPHPATVTGTGTGTGTGSRSEAPGSVWVFSGYGSQWPGMGRQLLDQEPAFAAAVDRLEPLLQRYAGVSLRAHLEPGAVLTATSVVQPVLFGLQVALAGLWRAHGLRPAAVIGHSMGEVAAAVVSGAIDEETGARIIAIRSRLLDGLSGGAMAVVDRSPEEVGRLAQELTSLRIAVYSSPGQCVVAGAADEVDRLIELVLGEGGLARPLPVAAAGHTPQVDPLLEPFAAQLGAVAYREPDCGLYTTVHQDPRSPAILDDAYWVGNLRAPVRFQQAVTAAVEDGHRIFVEVSPHPTQLYPLAETLRVAEVEDCLLLPTLRRDTDDAVTFRLSLAALLLRGALDSGGSRGSLHPGARIIDVPTARWRHQRYWANTPLIAVSANRAAIADPVRPVSTSDRLRACVAQVMGYAPESIDADTPLTELGLDSLQAVRILAAVKHEFTVELAPRVLLRQGTIAQVVALLEAEGGQRSAAVSEVACEVIREVARGVTPRDATERLIAQAWQSVSGEPATGVTDELAALAQNPCLATDLARALSDRLGQNVDIELIKSTDGVATIATIADRLRPLLETPADGPLRVLRAEGHQPPLFLIHPAGGSTAVYRALVQRLDPDQPCFGLERLPDLSEAGEQAVEYARLIRERYPTGPWAIGGWSYGGLVGQETARLLAAHGTVSALILIDSVLPLPAPELSPDQEVRQRFEGFAAYVGEAYGCTLELPYDDLATLDDATQIELVIKALQQVVDLPPAVLEHQRDSYLDLRAGERHTPNPYLGRTLLYRATEPAPHTVKDARYEREDQSLGWDAFCPDLSVRPLPGHHLSLLDPPVVDVLGRLIAGDLDPDLGSDPGSDPGDDLAAVSSEPSRDQCSRNQVGAGQLKREVHSADLRGSHRVKV